MTQETPVPRLDLAPKLKRPLSLWNPLDYLRLLYWVFYFPQALRWYVDTFGGGYIPLGGMNWRNPIQRNLFVQGLLLTVITPIALSRLLEQVGVSIDWFGVALGVAVGVGSSMGSGTAFSVALGVAFGVGSSMGSGVAFGVGSGVTFAVALGVVFTVGSGMVSGMAVGVGRGVVFDIEHGMVSGVFLGVASGMAFGMISSVFLDVGSVALDAFLSVLIAVTLGMCLGMFLGAGSLAFGMAFGMAFGIAFGVGSSMGLGIESSVALGVAFGVAILRPDSLLIGLPFNIRHLHKSSLVFSRITSLPIPLLSVRLEKWLQKDWETGLYNANQLLAYTLQFIPVITALNQVLNKIPPEQIIYRITQLAEKPFDWELVHFISANLNEQLKSEAVRGISFLPNNLKRRLQNLLSTETRSDNPTRATAAGFWYLHEKEPAKAEEAFTVVRPMLYGEEMYALAQNLAVFHKFKNFDDIISIPIETLHVTSLQSFQENILRPNTWQAISSLHRVVEDTQTVKRSISRTTRAFALNQAQGELTKILNNPQALPQAERELIIDIAQTWQKALLQVAGEVGEATITKPVRNPYIIGDPVIGEKFVGREEVMRQLEELWVMGEQLQSVVIYGHRRMGKTSILRNAANSIGSGVKVAYVNMLNAGNISEGVGEVLMAICDVVSEAVNVPPPDDDKLLQLPERTFQRYLKQVVNQLDETSHGTSLGGLIIAIDEFEVIEELITAGNIPINFLGYLRGLLQMNSKIAFAFAGLHTLEEMTADYFQPFFASVIPIHVGFMERAVTRQIIANPVEFSNNNVETLHITSPEEDFLLDYKPEALDAIYELTHGQPYLVQLIGFVLVRRYNDQVFELGRKRDPVFTVEDVEAVINNTEFFKRGRYYFEGVWSQAKQGAEGQQAVLKLLAPHPEGLNFEDVITEVSIQGFDKAALQQALDTLKRHDVIEETQQGKWRIIVELFRRWLLQ